MLQRVETDTQVTLADQLVEEVGPVVLVNTFHVAPADADALVAAWAHDAAYLKARPGYIATQLHRGIAGSTTFLNTAVWESVSAFRAAFGDPGFQATFSRYPDSTVASPHLFQKMAVPGICVDRQGQAEGAAECAAAGRSGLLGHGRAQTVPVHRRPAGPVTGPPRWRWS